MESFSGTVVHGEAYGRILGYRTANLDTVIESLSLKHGVYAATVHYADSEYQSALVVDQKRKKVEAHIFNFSGDLYGKQLHVKVHQYITELYLVKDEQELKEKIANDVQAVREYFLEKIV